MTLPVVAKSSSAIRSAFHSSPAPGQRAFWKRWFGISDPNCAAAVLETLLASKPYSEITAPEVSVAVRDYGLSGSQVRALVTTLWRRAVTAAVADDMLTDEEVAELAGLRFALQVGEDEAMEVEKEVIHPRFQQPVSAALADGRLTVEERAELDRLSSALRLSQAEVQLLYTPVAGPVMQKRFMAMILDHRVSPDELAELGSSGVEIGFKLGMSAEAEEAVRRYADFWKIENGARTPIAVSIRLGTGEACYYSAPAIWHELRRVTTRSNLGSVGYSFRIARGVYYRSPRVRLPSVTADVLTAIDAGSVYITNKRVIFDGARGNKTIRLSALLGFEPYSNGLQLEKATGKSPTLIIEGDAERACVILGAVLAQQ